MEREVGVVDAGVCFVNEVAEVHRDLTGLRKEGGVPGDVAGHGPEDAVGARLGGAAAKELGAGEPYAEDAVELAAAAVGGPLEHGEREGAARGAEAGRRHVVCRDGGPAVGGAEGGREEQRGAGPRAAARRADRAVHLEEGGRRLRRVGGGDLLQGRAEAVPALRRRCRRRHGGGEEEGEEHEEGARGRGGGGWRHGRSGGHEGRVDWAEAEVDKLSS